MNRIITQEQLDLFNQHFEIKMMREDVDYVEHDPLKPEHFNTDLLKNARLFEKPVNYSQENYKIYFISNKDETFGNQIKNISDINEIEDFILNDMEKFLNNQSETLKEKSFKEKLEVFNQNFTVDLVQTKEYYHGSDELTFKDLTNTLPVRDTITFEEPKDAHLEILESYHAINRGNELIRRVKSMGEVKYFIENDMEDYL